MIVQTNKVSLYEHFQEVLTASGHATIDSVVDDQPVIAIEIINYGAAQAWFNTGSHAGNATAADRIILVGERLLVPVSATSVNVFSTTGTSLEINFLH